MTAVPYAKAMLEGEGTAPSVVVVTAGPVPELLPRNPRSLAFNSSRAFGLGKRQIYRSRQK